MSEIAEILGTNIRSLRKKSGWTQEKLAEKAGISVPFMTQIELARKTASLEVVESIAKALNVSYERLFKSDISENKDLSFSLHVLENDLINLVSDSIHEKFQNLAID
ncbi:MAG: helix-turn-helix transcriptional regulator [Treponema sp.]|nr:helix-turn-helix transcriptional regulator [Treponema sp.]